MRKNFMPKIISLIYLVNMCCILNGQEHSLRFDGSGDYVSVPDHSDLDLVQNYTLEAWIQPETFGWLNGIISKYHTPAANGYVLRLKSQAPFSGISFDERETTNGILSSGQWYHLAAVKEGTQRRLYINGAAQSLSGSALSTSSNSNPLRFGSDYGGRYFNGKIDEIRLWNIARTQDEIISSMDISLNGDELGLVAYYNFNEGSGSQIIDQTGNNHNGTLNGNPTWSDGYSVSASGGDLNFDDQINIFDTVILSALILGTEQGNEAQIQASDINQDGTLDIADLILLIEWILDMDPTFTTAIENANYLVNNNNVIIETDGDLAGMDIELSSNEKISEYNIPEGWVWKQSGRRILAYSLDGSALKDGTLFKLNNNKIKNFNIIDWRRNKRNISKIVFPQTFMLKTSPNPFNPILNISYYLENDSPVEIKIFNTKGQVIETLYRENKNMGLHTIDWSPENLPSGNYFLRISDGINKQTSKILLLK